MKHILIQFFFLAFSLLAKSQISFQDKIESNGYGVFTISSAQVRDNGYIITGIASDTSPGVNFFLLKLDSTGNQEWKKEFGGFNYLRPRSVLETSDNGFIVSGTMDSIGGRNTIFLLKTDSLGIVQWCNSYSDSCTDDQQDIIETLDSGFAVVGSSTCTGFPGENIIIFKVDKFGNNEWSRVYGGSSQNDFGQSLVQLSDSGFFIAGITKSATIYFDILLMRLDNHGDTIWTQTLNDGGNEYVQEVIVNPDDEIFIVGSTMSPNAYEGSTLLLKVDVNGNVLTKKYTGLNVLEGTAIAFTNDSNLILGCTDAGAAGDFVSHACLVKINNSGDSLWSAFYLDTLSACRCVSSCSDGGYLFSGDTYVTKTDSFGQIPCNDAKLDISIVDENLQQIALQINQNIPAMTLNPIQFDTAMHVTVLPFCTPAEITRPEWQNGFSVFPNPTHSTLTVSIPGLSKYFFTVYDIYSQVLYSGTLNPSNQPFIINCNNFQPGIYFLNIQTEGNSFIQKFIKQ